MICEDEKTTFGRLHYEKQKLRRASNYSGPVEIWDEAEAHSILIELLGFFGHREGFTLPLPPLGHPGVPVAPIDENAMHLIQRGFDYFVALVHQRGKLQYNIYQEVNRSLNEAFWRGYNKRDAEYEEHATRQIEEEIASRSADWQNLSLKPDERVVYFIASEAGQIKIGIANDPEKRIRTLQTSHPAKLSILATCPGGQAKEREYHQRFAAHRLHGEWFERHPDILEEIERLSEDLPLLSGAGA